MLQLTGSNAKSSFHAQSLASSCSDQLSQTSGPIHISQFQQQSLASSCSDQLSQTSGPIHISQFQQQMRVQQPPPPQSQQLFYSNQQQQAQTLLHHPPFAPQPSSSNQASNFFNQFESNQLRAASANSSETQSSLNTISTRDTAIGVGSKKVALCKFAFKNN